MGDIVNFSQAKSRREVSIKKPSEVLTFSEEVDKDLNNLCEALDITKEQALGVATDFYRTYPMLMEFARSSENLLKR